MKARIWLNNQQLWLTSHKCGNYTNVMDNAKLLYPYLNMRVGLSGLCENGWQDGIINAVIDREDIYGFTRDDWFVMGGLLFCTDDDMAALLKLM